MAGARGNARRPFGHIGHPQAALELRQFPAAEGLVDVGDADVARRAVVAGEDHDGVVVQPVFFQGLQNTAHAAVHRADHGAVDTAAVVGDLWQGVVVFLAGLQRGVHTPMRQEQEKRPVLVAGDGGDGFVGEVVGQVLVGLEPGAAVVADAKAHVGPQELVDGVEVLLGVDDPRVFLGQVQATLHEQALVKALVVGPHLRCAAQMPLADVQRVIAAWLEQFGHRQLTGGQPQVVEVLGLRGLVLVDPHRVQAVGVGVKRAGHARHGARRGCEFNAKPPGVTTGHQRRTRHRAHGGAGMALVKAHTVAGDAVDVGRGHPFGSAATAVGGDVVDAQIVGHDDDDVGRALRGCHGCGRRALRPRHRLVRAPGMLEVGVPTQRILQDVEPVDIDHGQHGAQHGHHGEELVAQGHARPVGLGWWDVPRFSAKPGPASNPGSAVLRPLRFGPPAG